MILTIELSDQVASTLETRATGADLPLTRYLAEVLGNAALGSGAVTERRPKKSAYGLLAQYGPGPTAQEIDENRRQMFEGFGGGSQ
jgi:hypothetical protein